MKIYSRENETDNMGKQCMETNADNMEEKFLITLAKKVCEVLKVDWNDRQNMTNLLVSCLEEDVAGHKRGLLHQYEQYLFDGAFKRMKDELKLQ